MKMLYWLEYNALTAVNKKKVNSAFEGYIKYVDYLKYTLAAVAATIFSLSGVDISLLKTM